MPKIAVIGIGDDGIDAVSPAARERILGAELLLGSERALALAPPAAKGDRQVLSGDLNELASQLESVGERRAAVLIFGDPMFYGLAKYVAERLGKERFEVLPHVSSMQLAFARVMESWDEAYLTNLAGRPLDAVVEKIRSAQKVGLFTTEEVGPQRIAATLLDRGIDYFTAYVCENLGARSETVTRGTLTEIAAQDFDPLNVMILIRQPDAPDRPRESIGQRLFGNPDEAFLQAKPKMDLLTPAEVRAIALAEMDIAAGSIVWDVGAGSGSVSVEAAQLAREGTVYSIEMDPEDYGLIRENAKKFGVSNVQPVLGKAPEAWAKLPDPDCVFIAGGGREVTRIAEEAYERLRPWGRLVIEVRSINHVAELYAALDARTHDVEVWMVNISRAAEQLGRLSFEALNPCFLLATAKPDA